MLTLSAVAVVGALVLSPVPGVDPLPVDAPADYQLGGAYQPPPGVQVVARDRADPPAGTYAICYVNAFQTQPGTARWWRRNHPDLLLRIRGRVVADPGWPRERLLDIGSARKRRALSRIVTPWIHRCADDGFNAVEFDNLDSFTRSRNVLTAADAAAYARLLVAHAHRVGLATAQKNAAELLPAARSIGWDFAVVEECQVYRECRAFERVYRDAMIEIEYRSDPFAAACRARGNRIAVVLRDRGLTRLGRPGYRYRSC